MRATGLRAIGVLLLAAGACLGQTPATQPDIAEGTRTHTARGGGLWRAWVNTRWARLVCADANALWFTKGGVLWRYNVPARRVDVWTSPLTHPEFSRPYAYVHAGLASDGRFAAACPGAILLWDGREWSRLPQPNGENEPPRLAFDASGTLHALQREKAFRWEGSRWSLSVEVRPSGVLWPLGDKWFVWSGGSGTARTQCALWDAAFERSRRYDASESNLAFNGTLYPTGKGTVGVFRAVNDWEGPGVLCDVTQTDFMEKVRGYYMCLDLASGEAYAVNVPGDANAPVTICRPDGKAVAQLPPFPAYLRRAKWGVFLRDAAGQYWHYHWRSDGNAWQPALPPNGFDYAGEMRDALRAGRLKYDERRQTWFDAWPEIPEDIHAYDPNTRTGWVVQESRLSRPTVSERFEFAADGNRRLLATVKAGPRYNQWPSPQFQLAGDVWLNGVYRWDGRKLHLYDDGWEGGYSGTGAHPEVYPGPKGAVWMLHTRRTWHRYDPNADRFEDAEPFDDFRFDAGGRSLAIVGWPQDWDAASPLGVIYEKLGGAWAPMRCPIVRDEDVARDHNQDWTRARSHGVPGRLLRDGRMLLTWSCGVLEWDLASGRCAYLMPRFGYWAYFDGKGRRILVSRGDDGIILAYEGDPLAAEAASRPGDQLEATLRRLLAAMDSDTWRNREEATAEAVNLMHKDAKAVAAVLERADLARAWSAEVKARVAVVLAERPEAGDLRDFFGGSEGRRVALLKVLGNSLLERMHPPSAPKVRYVIEPGMDIEHARAVFAAAGALSSFDILNARLSRGQDLSCLGYLLPDNTMVYLRLSAQGAGQIVSLGLGEAGKGLDRDWDWSDQKKNSLKTLELKPYRKGVRE
jgi:hypothetical protein